MPSDLSTKIEHIRQYVLRNTTMKLRYPDREPAGGNGSVSTIPR